MRTIPLALLAAGLAGAAGAQELNIYNWGNYTSPELIEKFEAASGVTVKVKYGNSGELAGTILGGGSDAMSVAVAIDGEIVHEAAVGARVPDTFQSVTPSDRFRIASISKVITAITALSLVEDGLIGLDEPVGQRAAFEAGILAASDRAVGVTVRQLLTHTTGFAQYESLFFRNQVGSCEEAAGVGLTRPMGGGGFRYSNMNSCVLGLVIENVTGKSYETVVYERLLTPLGISGMRLAPTYDPGPGEAAIRWSVDA